MKITNMINANENPTKGKEKQEQAEDKVQKDQTNKVLDLVESENAHLFRDQYKKACLAVVITLRCHIFYIHSQDFKNWLYGAYYRKYKSAPSQNAILNAQNILSSRAIFDGETIPLEPRVAKIKNEIHYDLLSEYNEIIITKAGSWEITEQHKTYFKQYEHQKPQMLPDKSAPNLSKILDFIRIEKEQDIILFLVYLVACFEPSIPRPILIIHGPKGSAKTSTTKMIKSLVDPSISQTLTLSNNESDLIQKLDHHYLAAFDNITGLSSGISDTLCRAITGDSNTKRELFTNDTDFIVSYKRAIIINGINQVIQKPDLLDRGIILKLKPITAKDRKTEKEVWKAFNDSKPAMLAGIFEALSQSLGRLVDVQTKEFPRMADFAELGCAIAKALGYTEKQFIDAYKANIELQHEEVLEGSLIASAIVSFMEGKDDWEGSPSELLDCLNLEAENLKINTRNTQWPKGPNVITKRINEIAGNMLELGFDIETGCKDSKKRRIIKIKVTKNTVSTVTEKEESLYEEACKLFGQQDQGTVETAETVTPPTP